ncbi:MAG TPA: hypothetical protein VMD53_07590 [Rhizomicrobium sp.]|nr:hypothetical protein [Rhizomicrobium sp.]
MHNSPVSRRIRRRALLPVGALALAMVAFSSVAEPTDTPAGNPPPLSQQTFTLVQENGVDAKPHTVFDVQKTVTLKKGQMLVLKSSSGQMIEVAGPYHGKPLDHYTTFPPNGAMGYDAHSFTPHKHCPDTSGGSHPSGGPNPDETAGAEAHCR